MPAYNVFYFIIKPFAIPVTEGSSGSFVLHTETSPELDTIRNTIRTGFETNLQMLFHESCRFIPRTASRDQDVHIIQIPSLASNPASPDFSQLATQPTITDPIVYFVHRPPERERFQETPANPQDRSPVLTMLRALEDGHFLDFPAVNVREQRRVITDPMNARNENAGMALHGFGNAPAVAWAYSDPRANYDASNWQERLAYSFANVAFHEIAHCKAEDTNRARNSRWEPAIDSIHDAPGVSILSASGGGRSHVDADLQLMGQHMLCPIPFYRLDQPIANQCSHEGEWITLETA
jgi:hypothetical protein